MGRAGICLESARDEVLLSVDVREEVSAAEDAGAKLGTDDAETAWGTEGAGTD
jgi:hypothetical protein